MLPITVNWERSPSAPTPVFGVNTKQSYSPQPTDNVYDSGNFDKINPNVFMGKRANDGKLNFEQYGMYEQWHNKGKMFSQDNNSAWESNVSWAGNTGMSKSASYQGESVNFDQERMTVTQLTGTNYISNAGLLAALQATNRQVAKNSDNLVEMGRKQTKIGVDNTEQGIKIATLDSLVNDLTNVWQKTVGLVNTNTNAIKTNSDNLVSVGESINQINEDHKNMNKGGGGILPPLPPILPSLSLTTIALGGLAAYFLLRKK